MKEATKAGLRTGIYVRVSTDEQAQEGFSIRGQTEKLKAYALIKDWDIYDIYADEGISGKNIVDRPAINRLIDDINDRKVNNVLVFKVDRLTRNTKNLLELVELFEESNCAFNSLTESIDTDTPSGRMFLKIIGIFAEFERENLVSRLKLGFERKAKEGYSLATRVLSYGYDREKGQKVQEVLPEEAKIVKEIFSMYVDENKSITGIAKILNQRKIPTKMNVKAWDVSTVKGILMNPSYIGKVRYSMENKNKYFEVDGQHESIISEEMFYLAQERINNMPRISRTKRSKENNYFCGVLTCERCGSKFTTHNYTTKSGENKCTYRCIKKKSYTGEDVSCKSPEISHDKVEAAFSEYIERINDFSEIDKVSIDNDNAKKEGELQEYIEECQNKLNHLATRKKAVMEQYVNGDIPFEEYRKMVDIFNEKCELLENELQRSKEEVPKLQDTLDVSREDIMSNLKEHWHCLNNNERMTFLQRFIKRIVVKVEKEQAKSNVVKIEGIEFNTQLAPSLEQSARKGVRSALGKHREKSSLNKTNDKGR